MHASMQDRAVPKWATAPVRKGQFHLLIHKDGEAQRLQIDEQAGYLIGRNRKGCDIVCDDKSCSRIHACIAHHPSGQVHVLDLNSVHGTFVDGRELAPGSQAELTPGQTSFRLGACSWIFRLEHGSGPAQHASERAQHLSEREQSSRRRDTIDQLPDLGQGRHDQRQDRGMGGHRDRRRTAPDREDSRAHGEWRRPRSSDCMPQRQLEERSRPERIRQGPAERPSSFSAADPAAVVRQMAAPSAQAAPLTSTEQKRKLLWGNKGGGTDEARDACTTYGANRWDTAEFESEAERRKFIKLMGVQGGGGHSAEAAAAAAAPDADREGVLTADRQARVLGDVESQFLQGVRRTADARKAGLGM